MLGNLVGNALKFTKEGAVTVSAAVEDDGERGALCIRVEDTGAGIPKDRIDLIFEAFERGDSSVTRKVGGTGLGLAIVSKLVRLMGGRVTVRSEEGAGSSFCVRLRLPRPRKETSVVEPVPPRRAKMARRALVVDDDPTSLLVARRVIETLVQEVDSCDSGEAAVEAARTGDHDVIFMDVKMPGISGLEATRRIRNHEAGGRRVVIIAVTAHAMIEDRQRCLDAGMDDYMAKPLQLAELAAMVRRHLEG